MEDRDLDDLLELFNEDAFLRNATTRGSFASTGDVREWLAGIGPSTRYEIVATEVGKVIGCGVLFVLAERQSHAGWLLLAVRKQSESRGVGGTILRLLLETARVRARLRRIQIMVLADNHRALRLYRRAGFRDEGVHRDFVRDTEGYCDALTLSMMLDRQQ